jgi:hypothetical protein
MKNLAKGTLVLLSVLMTAGGAWAQMMGGSRPPQIPGMFKPVVGSGAEYRITTSGGKDMNWAFAIVGKENVDGNEGYWMEERMLSGQQAGMIMKELMVNQPGQAGIKRMIMQMPGRPPMEMPARMMDMMHSRQETAPKRGMGEKVGTETVTVPAGSFVCDHYRDSAGNPPSDIWVSTKVSPYGLVKMTSKDTSMELLKVLENETSQIKGEPQKFQMPNF